MCKVYADVGGGYFFLGGTIDAQTLNYTPSFNPIEFNELSGKSDDILIKEELDFSMTFAEFTRANLKLAFPMWTEFTGTGYSYGIGGQQFTKISTKFFKLLIHPVNQKGANGSDDLTFLDDDITVWKAANIKATPRSFGKDKPEGLTVTFTAYYDDSQVAGMKLALKGDPANTTIDVTRPTISTLKVEKSNVLTVVVKGTNLTTVDVDTDIEIVFSEELENGSAINHANYVLVNNTTGVQVDLSEAVITYDPTTKTVLINPAASITTAVVYAIGVVGVKDSAGNQIIPDVRLITAA
jgi:hypothetical protein